INLQRAQAATNRAVAFAIEHSIDFILAQEPYTRNGQAVGFPLKWTIYQQQEKTQPPRAILVCCQPNWTPLIIEQQRDLSAVLLQASNFSLLLISQYASPAEDLETTIELAQSVLQRTKLSNVIIAGDYNAHHTNWGYSSTDTRGRQLEDFISTHNLILHNSIDSPPTFDRIFAVGWPDLTLSTVPIAQHVQDWKVEEADSLSDHKFITFKLNSLPQIEIIKRYNMPSNKKRQFSRKIDQRLSNLTPVLKNANTQSDMESLTDDIMKILHDTCEELLPTRSKKKLNATNWWNTELTIQRKKMPCAQTQIKARTA
ncbi:uncharacterized protein LOC118203695, partial [Stegodyphus dumicola]|uniref:uncharacterized protein LOC118203695 n=1 Tax=Stegodyphus dumicola TaxID=202533 RepID=UPI0015AD61AB